MNTPPLGWIEPKDRTRPMREADDLACAAMPRRFNITGTAPDPGPFVNLMELWKHPQVVAALGFEFPGVKQITGSCFVAGTAVRMSDGTEKPIEKIEVGDEVFSHTGAKRKVVRTFKRNYTGTLHTFHVKGWRFPVTMTADHDCLTVKPKESVKHRYEYGGFQKKKAEAISIGERFLLPNLGEGKRQKLDLVTLADLQEVSGNRARDSWRGESWEHPRYVEVCEKLAYILGLYLADGSLKYNKVIFHLNPDGKKDAADKVERCIREIFGEVAITRAAPKPTCLQVIVHDAVIAKMVRALVPDTVYSKRLPGVLLASPKSVRLAALRGWFDGDGHFCKPKKKGGTSARGVTASEGLARDMGQLALACGLRPSVLRRKKAKHQRVASMDVYINGQDTFEVYPEHTQVAVVARPRLMERTPYGFAAAIENIDVQSVVDHPVYCCEVEEEHSLIVNGLAQHQCVGAGGGNVIMTLCAIEVVRLNDPEQIILPFWLYPYGKSRELLGDRSEGEGSLGSTFAQACKQFGVFSNAESGLPQPDNSDGLVWGQAVEMKWSNGTAAPRQWVDLGKNHLVKTTTPLKSSAEIRDAIRNGYPVTFACNNFVTPPGRVEGAGADACCVGSLGSSGGHQTSLQAVWDHPTLGLLFWNQNQWGKSTYTQCPKMGRRDGCWHKAADIDRAIRSLNAEIFAFSQYDGYPAQVLSWGNIYNW